MNSLRKNTQTNTIIFNQSSDIYQVKYMEGTGVWVYGHIEYMV